MTIADIKTAITTTLRDYLIDGVAGVANKPSKKDLRNALTALADAVVPLSEAATITGVKTFNTAPSMPVGITDLPTPTNANDAVRKAYVDAAAAAGRVPPLAAVACATTGDITLSGEQTIDDVLTSASRVLAYRQTDKKTNGIYLSGSGAWTRATDADTAGEIGLSTVFVEGGTVNVGKTFQNQQLASSITLGTTDLTWALFDDNNLETVRALAAEEALDTKIATLRSVLRPLNQFLLYKGGKENAPSIIDASGKVLEGMSSDGASFANTTGSGGYPATAPEALSSGDYPATVDWNGVLTDGQSLSLGSKPTAVVSSTQPYSNLTFGSGPRSSKPGSTVGNNSTPGTSTVIPLVENLLTADGGTHEAETECSGMANGASQLAAMEDGIDPNAFIVAASCVGHEDGTYNVANLSKGSTWYQMFIDHVTDWQARATAAGKTYALQMVYFCQGATDLTTDEAVLKAQFIQLRSDMETDAQVITGQTSPVAFLFMVLSSHIQSPTYDGRLQRVQFELCRDEPHFYFGVPTYALPYGPDTDHLVNTGYLRGGAYGGRALKRLVRDRVKPQWLHPISATARGTEFRLKCSVPQRPLHINIDDLAVTADNGIKITDGTGTLTLLDFRIADGDTLVITMDRALGTSPVFSYAETSLAPGLAIEAGASGNLTDSESSTYVYSGVSYPLVNIMPAFSMPITVL